jgi:DNA invertase Pin-like site-specific DNA recombinase
MIYGYVRVSTDQQTMANQHYEIERFCKRNKFHIGEWIEETISGTKRLDKRKLGALLQEIKPDDLIICSELSRLGRNLLMIMTIIAHCQEIGAKIWTIKDNFRLDDGIQSKVLAFAFGLAAEIERNLISQRTKEALALRKAEGMILGRHPGKAVKVKLSGHEAEIKKMLQDGKNNVEIGKCFGVHRQTVRIFVKERMNKGRLKNVFIK